MTRKSKSKDYRVRSHSNKNNEIITSYAIRTLSRISFLFRFRHENKLLSRRYVFFTVRENTAVSLHNADRKNTAYTQSRRTNIHI